ncbi:MAG: IMPACT family protein [Bacteroidales bacterium]
MSTTTDEYYTIEQTSQGIYKEKGSKFIALAFPVKTEEEVKEVQQELRKKYHDARHHCYAYVIGFKGEAWRANDDGEPSSTAGKPIHGQILSRNLTNTLVVVIRYFGGTKLGVSGLINAYKTAASEALDANEVVKRTINDIYRLSFDYEDTNDIMRLLKDDGVNILEQNFGAACDMVLAIRQGLVEQVLDKVEKIDSAEAEYLKTQ